MLFDLLQVILNVESGLIDYILTFTHLRSRCAYTAGISPL